MSYVKKLLWIVFGAILIGGILLFVSGRFEGTAALQRAAAGETMFLPLVIVAALIDSINPCAFSILLLTIGFLFSLGKVRSDILKIGGMYILGLFTVYILIGLGILGTLNVLNIPHILSNIGAGLVLAFGAINLINYFFPQFPIKLKVPQAAHQRIAHFIEKGSVPTAFGLGVLVGMFEFPCTGGPYLLILGMLHDRYLSGFGYLVLYNLIFISPLVVILLVASNDYLLAKVQEWRSGNIRRMHLGSGMAMIGLGLLILAMNYWSQIQFWLGWR